MPGFSSSSRVVFITGANSGIGFETAKTLVASSEDFHVVVGGLKLQWATDAVKEISNLTTKPDRLTAVEIDVRDFDSIQSAVEIIDKKFGRIDALVNNAGVGNIDPDLRTRMQACLSVNAIGPALVSETARSLLLRSLNPYSIYLSSFMGSMTVALDPTGPQSDEPYDDAYRVSKAALNMVMVLEHLKFRAQGVKVFAVDPWVVRTDIRGTSEEARNAGGLAISPTVPAGLIFSIVRGDRDSDAGRMVGTAGVQPW